MAESAISSAIALLGKILVEEGKHLYGAQGKVKEMQEELRWMYEFLKKADVANCEDEIYKMSLQHYASDAEDIIDRFYVKVVCSRQQNSLLHKLRRYSCIWGEVYGLHEAASAIDALKVKLSILSTRLERYGMLRYFGINIDRGEPARNEKDKVILRKANLQQKNIVGLEAKKKKLISQLSHYLNRQRFHAICGMDGSGKTTLATRVYKDESIQRHFSGGQAFIYISKRFKVESVLEELLIGLNSKSSDTGKDSLVSKVQEVLNKNRCLVVLDGIHTNKAWDSLKPAFVTCGEDSGSRLLFITRNQEVANYVYAADTDTDTDRVRPDLPFFWSEVRPDLLENDGGWDLLCLTMGWELHRTQTGYTDDDIKKLYTGKKMLELCRGVPLAIVVLSGILKKKEARVWESVLQNISSNLEKEDDDGKTLKVILQESYNNLPSHLKSCFLQLAQFEEDDEIQAETLHWMWVAEGLFTRLTSDRTTRRKSLEDIVNDCLNGLAEAYLVEIVSITSQGSIESIRMSYSVREVCSEKANADNFLRVIDPDSGPGPQLDEFDSYDWERLLRMVIYIPPGGKNSVIKNSLSSDAPKYIKSLKLIQSECGTWEVGDSEQLMTCICRKFQLLRVLVLEKMVLCGRLTSQVEVLVHLRYLSLRGASVSELPSSIGNLRLLEILDLKVENKIIIPNTLWKLFRLRILLFPLLGYGIKRSKRLRIDTLIHLEMIENLQVRNLRTKDLVKAKYLRNVSISDEVGKEAVSDIMDALSSTRLQSCSLGVKGDVISCEPGKLRAIVCSCYLKIEGPTPGLGEKPVDFPQHLEAVELHGCQLENDPMRALGSLRFLKTLKLCKDSYVGKEVSCHSGSFSSLTYLKICTLEKLEVWKLEQASMPKLEGLCIEHCSSLKETPYVLPLSLKWFLSNGNDQHSQVNLDSSSGIQTVHPYGVGRWLSDAVLRGKHQKVVLVGSVGAGKATNAMNLYCNGDVHRHFDAVARTWVPGSRSCSATSGLLPRSNLEQLLRILRDRRQSRVGQDLSQMSCDDLMAEIQQVMQQRKCLVILVNLEVDFDRLDADLEKTFGPAENYAEAGSKFLITSQYDTEAHAGAADCHTFRLRPPTPIETWDVLYEEHENYCRTDAGIKWNMMGHCLENPQSAKLFPQLLEMTDCIDQWRRGHKGLADSSPIGFIFTSFLRLLENYLGRCLAYLANFPKEVEISTKKLYQMWSAAGIVALTEYIAMKRPSSEHLESAYLSELVEKGLVTVLKRGPNGRAKKCQLKSALRDLCLKKAQEDSMPIVIDQTAHTTSMSNANLRAQLLAVNLSRPPTSLLFFPIVSNPVQNEEQWEWLLYICTNFHCLQVLDLERMWMTKGSLPTEVGNLLELRYLSLRRTWVTQLPQSIEYLIYLETLDLRVLGSIFIPNVLWKLHGLKHLYLPDIIAQETAKLRLSGLSNLETLVNLHTDKICLRDLLELKQLREMSIRNIHTMKAVDELDGIPTLPYMSLVCINSEVINANPTILAGFQNLLKLKIKGMISSELHPEMFPANLKEVILKHTKLEEDPLPVLEKLPQLSSLFLDHESFLGKKMTFSMGFHERANLILCSLSNLEELCVPPPDSPEKGKSIEIIDCRRLTETYPLTHSGDNISDAVTGPRCFNLSPLKKGLRSFTHC